MIDFNLREIIVEKYAMPTFSHDGISIWKNKDGEYHRLNGLPSFIDEKRKQVKFYKRNKLHRRNNMPALIMNNYVAYYQEDVPHRTDGPAIIDKSKVEYWENGNFLKKEKNK
jgi:hypothetical protein